VFGTATKAQASRASTETNSGQQCGPHALNLVSLNPHAGKTSSSGTLRRRFVFAAVCAATIAGIGVGLWFFVVRDRVIPKRFGVVVAGEVYRSGQISRYLIADVIDRYQIGTIVDLNGFDPSDADQQAEAAVSQSKGVHHYCFPLRGNGTGQIAHYADAVETIVNSQRNRVPVLVHCYAGTQRTGACVSFYRLLIRKDRPEDVYEELGRYGWDAGANQVLVEYVNAHLRELAELLVQRHALDRIPDELPSLHP
jgi:hypothetical protein